MDSLISTERIERIQEILRDIHHIAIATVNQDGSPHNTPVFAAFDEQLNFYWSSHPESEHSKNIARTQQAFIVVFDSREGHGGLYVQATTKECQPGEEMRQGYVLLKKCKEQFYGAMGSLETYQGAHSQWIYKASPQKVWLNKSGRDEAGAIILDRRYEISLADLG